MQAKPPIDFYRSTHSDAFALFFTRFRHLFARSHLFTPIRPLLFGMIKRMRQSLGADHYDQLPKDMSLLEKYIEEIARCKTEKDVWSTVEVGKRF